MRLRSKLIIGALLILLLAGLTGQASRMAPARAADPTPEPYQRQVTLKVSFTFYEWWVVRWRNNEVACQLFIEHEGLPTEGEVQYYCDRTVYNEWRVTAPCPQAMDNGDVTRCPGLYLHFNYLFPFQAGRDGQVAHAQSMAECDGLQSGPGAESLYHRPQPGI